MKVITDKVPIKIWVNDLSKVEEQAIEQLRNVAKLPYIFSHIAVMPDVHLGVGATIGSVIAGKGAVSPSAVGVDIGCGMLAIDLCKKLDDFNLKETFDIIENTVPLGFSCHANPFDMGGLELTASERVKSVWKKASIQVGTLGGGNHFIELCDDGHGNAYLMLHSGSRGVGNQTARIHIDKAKKLMDIWKIELADPSLAYLAEETPEFKEYIEDVHWCQDYAMHNRQMMLKNILKALGLSHLDESTAINCHHNYIAQENHFGSNVWVTRKGAVRARKGDMGIIPSAMGQKSYIVEGLGNKDSFCSCSHGAGRVMSRTKAKANHTIEDMEKQTEGVVCRKDKDVIDEIPSAYKNIDEVMENQKDLVKPVKELKAVLCVKG